MSDGSRSQTYDPVEQVSAPAATKPAWIFMSRHWAMASLALILLAACAAPVPIDSPMPEASEDTASQDTTGQRPESQPIPPRKDPDPGPARGPDDAETDDKPPADTAAPAEVEPAEEQPDLPATEPAIVELQRTRIEPKADSPDGPPKAPEVEQEASAEQGPDLERVAADRRLTEPPPTQELSGHIRILQNGREQTFASMHLSQTVVAWMPDQPVAVDPMPERRMITRQRLFFPDTLVLTSGTPVRFPNMDSIDHNVFSLTPDHRFDVGRYGESEGRTHIFEGSGVVEILCNLHANMRAYVLVLETPFFATPDEDGRFLLQDLPDGPGELMVWNYRASEQVQQLMLDPALDSDMIQVDVDITRSAIRQRRTN